MQTQPQSPDDSAGFEIAPEIDTFQQTWAEPAQVVDDVPAVEAIPETGTAQQSWAEPAQLVDDVPAIEGTPEIVTVQQTWMKPVQVSDDIQLPEANNPSKAMRPVKVSSRGRFRPRHKVAQQSINESYLRNFPEVAAPEGSDVPMEEQLAIKEALFEIKKEKSRF